MKSMFDYMHKIADEVYIYMHKVTNEVFVQ